jgi:hypothetical protein
MSLLKQFEAMSLSKDEIDILEHLCNDFLIDSEHELHRMKYEIGEAEIHLKRCDDDECRYRSDLPARKNDHKKYKKAADEISAIKSKLNQFQKSI